MVFCILIYYIRYFINGLLTQVQYKGFFQRTPVKEEKQYITDLYKICLHEDITGKVSSPLVPFGKEGLRKESVLWLLFSSEF